MEGHGAGEGGAGGRSHLEELEEPVSWDPHQGNWGRGNLQLDSGADCPLLQWGQIEEGGEQ